MKYKIGIENMYGNLLNTEKFNSDNEMYNWIGKKVMPYVKTGDLKTAKIIVQVYPNNEEISFENCILQYQFYAEELL